MADAFPRLLVATEFPPNAGGGGPAVVRQMLKDWPRESLFWWSCLPDPDQRFGQAVAAHRVAAIPPRLYPRLRLLGLKSWLIERFWAPYAGRHLQRTLKAFNPDVVWVIPHLWAVLPLAAVLPSGRVRFHVTVQDYVYASQNISDLDATIARLAAAADRLYVTATTRDATSHPMIADLQARTGSEAAQMLHAGLEDSDFAFLGERPGGRGGDIRIAYAGTILVEREFALFAQALARIRAQLPRPLRLEFFGGHSYRSRSWFDPEWMRERGNLPEPALTQALRECTWGFAPMSLSDDVPRYNRFSFPTKFISYLAAGLPVITLGHPESSIMKMAEAYQVGPRLGSEEGDRLARDLLVALSVADPWARYAGEIQRCARAEFDAARMRKTLYECFRTCAGKR